LLSTFSTPWNGEDLRSKKIQTLPEKAALGSIRLVRSYSRGHGRKGYRLVHEVCLITPMILKTGRDLMRCGDRPNDLKRLGRKDLYLLNLR
jgi:hypothetical protein